MTHSPDPAVGRVLTHVSAEYPHLTPSCLNDDPDRVITLDYLSAPDTLAAATAASSAAYSIESPRHATQVWWYSLCNSITKASLAAAVEMYKTPLLDFECGQLFIQPAEGGVDNYWYGFTPHALVKEHDITARDAELIAADARADKPRAPHVHALLGDGAGSPNPGDYDDPDQAAEIFSWVHTSATLCRTLTPLVEAVAAHSGITAPTLWAVLADAVIGGCAGAGNDSFDPHRGVLAAEAMAIGAGALWPAPRLDVVRDGEFTPLTPNDSVDDDDHVLARRASCCMIFHSTTSGKCLSCPKQKPAERTQKLLDYVAGLG